MEGKTLNRRMILLPIPLQGHIIPAIHLATLLHSKGFSITIIQTHFNAIDPTQYPQFTFLFLDAGLAEKLTASDDPNPRILFSALNTYCLEPLQDCLSQILSAATAEKEIVACLISDPHWSFAGTVADRFQLPRLTLRIFSMSLFVITENLPVLREKGYFHLQEDKAGDPVQEFTPLKVRDLPNEEFHKILATKVKFTKASHGIICNTFEEIEASVIEQLRQDISIPIFPIGPLNKYSSANVTTTLTEDQSTLSWLDTQAPKSVLYVSFGSLAAISETEFLEIAWALADSNQPFLWVVRPGLSRGSKARDPLPDGYLDVVRGRGHIVSWAPQLQVLAHPSIGGFWTHNGWNSTIESISEGVPMLCLPLFLDLPMNAGQVCDKWKIGLRLEKGMKRDELKVAIKKLMVEVEGEEMRNRATTLKESARQCLEEGGSSYRALEALTNYILSFSESSIGPTTRSIDESSIPPTTRSRD